MAKRVDVTAQKRKHPTENHEEVVLTKTVSITQEQRIPLDLVPGVIAALRADRERLLDDIAEIDRQIAALEALIPPGDQPVPTS